MDQTDGAVEAGEHADGAEDARRDGPLRLRGLLRGVADLHRKAMAFGNEKRHENYPHVASSTIQRGPSSLNDFKVQAS